MSEASLAGPPTVATIFLVVASPAVGSFLATVAYRLPRGQSPMAGRSACPSCGHVLGAADLVPLFGYAFRGGRCGHCGEKIPGEYPLVEAAAVFATLWSVAELGGWLAWIVAVLGWFLLALAAIDLKHYSLPDVLTLPLMTLGLSLAALGVAVPGLGWPVSPFDAAIGALAGFASLAAVGAAYRILRAREGMGLGDAKLLAAAGAWTGWQGLASVVLIAALAALAVTAGRGALGRRWPRGGDRLAFGPYLALGTWLVVLYGPLLPKFLLFLGLR